MLVIHPEDRTTDVLKILYEGLDAHVIVDDCSRPVIDHLLKHASTREQVMLLGHGSDMGRTRDCSSAETTRRTSSTK